jgi:hypothetical protein
MTCNNSTDKKVTIKRRADGVYDIYVDDIFVESRGNYVAAAKRVEEILEADIK